MVDAETEQPLEAATVFLETQKDSTLLTYTITGRDGLFELEGQTGDPALRLEVSYVGYAGYQKKLQITNEPIDLGAIKLETQVASLGEVLVQSRAPITVKKDTLEFNVASFKTKKDATVEDLLKELPGVEVDAEGKITVNGKEVNEVLVNGKPFFGDDPTIATRNLTKEIIEKVQVTDTKTKSEAFAGEDADGESKSINLTIKEENNKGTFGRVAAGGGTDDRFEYAGLVNIFDNERRISVLGGGNNINAPGFSFGEIQKMFGGGNSIYISSDGSFGIDGRSFGGGQGIVNSRTAGANYADEYGEKFSVSSDFFYSGSNSNNESRTSRENILPDRRYFTNSSSASTNNSDNYSFNAQLEITPDTTFLVTVQPSFNRLKSQNQFERAETSRAANGDLINQSATKSFTTNKGTTFENDLQATKRFGTAGAFVRVGVETEFNRTESEDLLETQTEVFEGAQQGVTSRNQLGDVMGSFESLYTSITYRLPLQADKWFLDFEYSYRNDRREEIRSTFDFNDSSNAYDLFNADLSTNFTFNNKRSTPGLELVTRGEKYNASAGISYVNRTLESIDALRDIQLKEDFEAIELSANVSYRFSTKMSLYSNYRLSNSPPDLRQLQPFQDVSDPLNTVTGNPDLRPTNTHNGYLGLNNYDYKNGVGYNLYGGYTFINDQVVTRTIVDENLVRNTTYVNVDGGVRSYFGGRVSRDIKLDSLRTLKYQIGASGDYNRSVNFNNDVLYASKSVAVSPNAGLTFTWNELFELRPSYRVSFTRTQFDLDAFDDQEFVSHNATLQTATFFPKKLEWLNEINYNYNPNVAPGFNRSAWFWNATLAYSMLGEKATLTLKVYDLLNQNTNARRIATANYIEDRQSTVLQQYFMLSFSYKFNSLGSKGEAEESPFFFF
ncbi:outer membrane beta-barrel protein [Croceiramulus getboli]|nr:outer membrane beta-barrel protein [Flavobacteriaceae bacterium YJPT1-3]